MGWSCSWIAVQGVAKGELLEALGLVETGEQVEPGSRRAGICFSERPNGWTVVFNEDANWADSDQVSKLSHLGRAVGCQFEDRVAMTSVACAAQDGVALWRVFHVNNPIYRLDVSGNPPAELAGIRDEFFRKQEEDGGEKSSVDFVHDVPLEVAKAACGYRADDEEDLFAVLEPAGFSAETPPKPGLLGWLFAPFRSRS